MDYYDWNFQNPTVNGTQLVKSGRLNPEIGLNDTSLIAGTSIVVEKTAEGKIKISASSSGPSAPTGYLTVASPKTGLFTYTIGGDSSGNVNVYYQGSATAEKVMMGTLSTFSKTFTRSSSAGTVFQDDSQKITLFRCDGQEVTSADVSNNIYMKELSLNDNRLTSIDVDNLADLEYLNVINNSISSIDISNNTKLESIFVGGNPISSLNIATPVALVKHIDIRSTEIKSFDFSPYTNLVTADISGTSISSFSCHSPNLVSVGVYNSPVNSINITAGRLGNNGVTTILTSIETYAPILGVEPGTIIITGQQEYVIGETLYFAKKRLEENGWTVVLDPYEELLYREMSTPTGMTSNSNASWEVLASSEHSSDVMAYRAFDGLTEEGGGLIWHSNSGSPQWIQWKAVGENPNVLIKDLYLMSDTVSGNTLWYPIDFELQGSNDGEAWTTILSVTGVTDWQSKRWTYKRFPIPDNEQIFIYHRIYVSSNNGYCSIAEIKAFPKLQSPVIIKKTVSPTSMTNNSKDNWIVSASSIWSPSYDAFKAFNGSWNGVDKGWVPPRGSSAPQWLQWMNNTEKTIINSYKMQFFGDSGNRYFTQWELQGSDNGSDWNTIDEVIDNGGSISSRTIMERDFDNDIAYYYHRILIKDVPNSYAGICEIEAYYSYKEE